MVAFQPPKKNRDKVKLNFPAKVDQMPWRLNWTKIVWRTSPKSTLQKCLKRRSAVWVNRSKMTMLVHSQLVKVITNNQAWCRTLSLRIVKLPMLTTETELRAKISLRISWLKPWTNRHYLLPIKVKITLSNSQVACLMSHLWWFQKSRPVTITPILSLRRLMWIQMILPAPIALTPVSKYSTIPPCDRQRHAKLKQPWSDKPLIQVKASITTRSFSLSVSI